MIKGHAYTKNKLSSVMCSMLVWTHTCFAEDALRACTAPKLKLVYVRFSSVLAPSRTWCSSCWDRHAESKNKTSWQLKNSQGLAHLVQLMLELRNTSLALCLHAPKLTRLPEQALGQHCACSLRFWRVKILQQQNVCTQEQ